MSTYVRPRRPSVPSVRFVQDPTVYTSQAIMIPDGMHGAPQTDDSLMVASTMKKLVASGVHPERARALVGRALGRIRRRHHAGLGDEEVYGPSMPGDVAAEQLLAAVRSRAADFQRQHADLIAKIPAGKASGDLLKIRNAVDALYADWTAYAVDAKGGVPPYQWNRTDPVDAILIAVRDDLRDTVNLLDANKAQQVLAKQIADLPKLGTGKSGPLFGVDVPWYVWAGAAVAGAAVAGKSMHLW